MTPAVRLSIGDRFRPVPARGPAKWAGRARSVECRANRVTYPNRTFERKDVQDRKTRRADPRPRPARAVVPRRGRCGGGRRAAGHVRDHARLLRAGARPIVRTGYGRELPAVRPRRILPGNRLSPGDPGVHDPGRGIHQGVSRAPDPGADPQRGRPGGSRTTGERSPWPAPATRTPPPCSSSSTSSTTISWTTAARPRRGWGYTVFGRVVEGMDTVDRIAALPTGSGGPFPKDVPLEAVVIRDTRVHPVD